MKPTTERFRALARSSPWRWSTLRYVQKRDQSGREDVLRRAFIRRPKLARVEQLDGTLEHVHREPSQTVTPLSRRGDAPEIVLPNASDVEVELDEDGLVRWRPGPFEIDADVPMVGNYYDVALLVPVELADGGDDDSGAIVESVRVVDHHGRLAWEAVLRPTAYYDPLCPCCPLLLPEGHEGSGLGLREQDPGFAYPDAHRVRLDVATGVCVFNEQIGGTRNGSGHDIEIEAVDEPMGDELIPEPPPSRWARIFGRR